MIRACMRCLNLLFDKEILLNLADKTEVLLPRPYYPLATGMNTHTNDVAHKLRFRLEVGGGGLPRRTIKDCLQFEIFRDTQ